MVRFWDSSALIPLVIQEERSPACRRLFQEGVAIAVWSLTRTEMVSALWRRARAGELDLAAMPRVLARLERLAAKWHEIGDLELVRDRAERLLEHHELRAAGLGAGSNGTRDRVFRRVLDRTGAPQELLDVDAERGPAQYQFRTLRDGTFDLVGLP